MIFFFKQKTAYGLRISDWSSDVCSSDLRGGAAAFDLEVDHGVQALVGDERRTQLAPVDSEGHRVATEAVHDARDLAFAAEAAGGAGSLGRARGGLEDDLGHRRSPTSEIAPERNDRMWTGRRYQRPPSGASFASWFWLAPSKTPLRPEKRRVGKEGGGR